MAYDKLLSGQIEALVKTKKGFSKKEMFGGVGFLLNGNLCIGVRKNDLLLRVDPETTNELLKKKGVSLFRIAGRTMKGWLLVSPDSVKGVALNTWFEIAYSYVKNLPKK